MKCFAHLGLIAVRMPPTIVHISADMVFFSRQLGRCQRYADPGSSCSYLNRYFETEPFNEDGTWRTSMFYNITGPSFVNVALRAARAADPNAKLYVSLLRPI